MENLVANSPDWIKHMVILAFAQEYHVQGWAS